MGDSAPRLAVIESVRCLECGAVYARADVGGRMVGDAGCPCCGYVGWIPASVPVPPGVPRRADWQPRLVRSGRAG